MARNMVGVPYENPARYVGPGKDLIPIIKVSRAPTTSDVRFPLGQFWLVGDSPSTGTVGDLWYLCDFVAGVPQWCQIAVGAGSPGIDTITGSGGTPISPDVSGNVDLAASTVANATHAAPLYVNDTVANTLTLDLQVAAARTGAPGDKNDVGVCSFDDTAFSVDANGYVTLAGGAGPSIDTINIDANTGPGTNPVVPDGSGEVTVNGNTVANATNAEPVYTHSRAANTYNVEVQVATGIASAPGDKLDAGLASFDSADFTVDADGFVQLAAGPSVAAGEMHNLAFTHNGTTMTLHSRDGTALSATNVGYIAMPSNATEGQIVLQAITANQTLTIADMNGATFGTDASVAWGNNMPLYVGFIAKDDDTVPIACICRVPNAYRTPTTSTEIGDPTTPAQASTEASVFAWSNLSAYTDYDSNHVQVVGSFRATKNSSDAWTFVTMDEQDGVNLWNDNRQFLMPYNQNGAASGSHFALNGGTTGPAFDTDNLGYTVYKDGLIDLLINFNACNTAGVGAVTAYIPTPYNIAGQLPGTFIAAGATTHTHTWSLAQNTLSKCAIDLWLTGATAARTLAGFTTTGDGNTFLARATCRINVGVF